MCGKWQADILEGPCHEWSKEEMYLAPVWFCSRAICLPHFSPHSMLTTNFLYCKLFFMKVIRLLSRFWCQPCSSAPSPHATHMHTHSLSPLNLWTHGFSGFCCWSWSAQQPPKPDHLEESNLSRRSKGTLKKKQKRARLSQPMVPPTYGKGCQVADPRLLRLWRLPWRLVSHQFSCTSFSGRYTAV